MSSREKPSSQQGYQTPPEVVSVFRAAMGNRRFDFDPCTVESNPTGAADYFAHDMGKDAFVDFWPVLTGSDLAYINPEYRRIPAWIELVHAMAPAARHLWLLPDNTSSEWWHHLLDRSDLVVAWRSPVFGPRISFINPETGEPDTQNNRGSTIFYRDSDPERVRQARRVLELHGSVLRG